MIRGIVRWSLSFRFLVIVIAAVLMVFGIIQLRNMPVDVLPEFAPPYVEIQTEALGLSAEEVEQLITAPMEQDLLNGVPWLDHPLRVGCRAVLDRPRLRSRDRPHAGTADGGRAHDPGVRAATRVQAADDAPAPVVDQPGHDDRAVLEGCVPDPDGGAGPLDDWAPPDGRTRRGQCGDLGPAGSAAAGPGRSETAEGSTRFRCCKFSKPPGTRLWVSSLSFVEASTPGTGGFIDTPNQRLGIRHIFADRHRRRVWPRCPSRTRHCSLGDVANVVEDHQPLIGDALTNDGPSLLLVVEKLPERQHPGCDAGGGRSARGDAPGLPGIEIDRRSTGRRLHRDGDGAISPWRCSSGLLLLVVVLGAFLFDWRAVLVSLVAIPVSLIAQALVLYLRGGDHQYDASGGTGDRPRRRGRRCDRRRRKRRAAAAAASPGRERQVKRGHHPRGRRSRCAAPSSYATLILLLAVAPLFFIEGLSGAFFQPLALSYVLAVLASMVVALTVTPALCLLLLANAPLERRAVAARALAPAWLRARSGADRPAHRAWRSSPSASSRSVGLAAVPFLSQSLLPSFKEREPADPPE